MRPILAFLTVLTLGLGLWVAGPAVATSAPKPAAPSTVSPVADRSSTAVTADALPTVQIDGVVWSQAIVGDTVYAGGQFTNARPAGAPVGAELTPRSNLLAYNLTTGDLITSFHPVVDGVIKTVVASPDGSRVYIGGSFTTIDGHNRYRLAAFDTATGTLINTFAPGLDATVNTITATNSTVYAGGVFSKANGENPRSRLAAFSTDGGLLAWAPTADDTVNALLLTPDGAHVVVGGAFANLDNAAAPGLGSLDAVTGASVPFAVNQVVKDYGAKSAILSLSTDGTAVYGTGYDYSGGRFEGTFSADPTTGAINWLEDCHGDSYGSYASGGQVYVVSHEHYCGTLGGFPEKHPTEWHRSTAFTTQATGTLDPNGAGGSYASFTGNPSPSQVNWYPDLAIGSFTKQYQAAWTVTGNGQYVIEGGEFLDVNGTPQQGLVRFAIPSLAPSKRGPMDSTSPATAALASDTSATIHWPANWDQDDNTLTYKVMRSGTTAPVFTTTAVSEFWKRPTLTFTDTGLHLGTTYSYTVVATDPDGNTATAPAATVTTPGATTVTSSASPATPVTGQKLTVRSAVKTVAVGAPDATGTVTVSVDGKANKPTALTKATSATALAGLAVGRHTITVLYSGDAHHAKSMSSRVITVAAGRSAARVTSSAPRTYAHRLVRFHAYVTAVAPATGRPTGTVVYYVDGHRRVTRTLHAGTTTYSVRLPRGRHSVKVRYAGTSSYRTVTSKAIVQIER